MKNKITLGLFIFILAAGLGYSQDKQDWKFMHPTPQVNNLRKIKMIDSDSWVTVGANGTYMKTSNSGNDWYFHHFAGEVDAALKTTYNYDTWFFNENTGIVVGDQGYIGRTTDGGVSFDTSGNGLLATNIRCWVVWFANANTGYVGAGSQTASTSRILKTTNGGISWTTVFSSSSAYVTALGGMDADNVIASYSNGTTLKTTNGGANWTETASQLFSIPNNITFLNSTTGFACGSSGQAKRTTNSGATWDIINTPTSDWSMFQIKIESASSIYAVGDPGFLYKSTDLGTTWSFLPIAVSGPAVTFIWYSLDINGSTMVMSGDYGIVAVSTNGGVNWTSNSQVIKTALNFDITTIPGTSKYWIAGRHSAGGKQILYSSNSGTNWTYYDLGMNVDFQAISMINENTGYITGTNSTVMKTTNGGVNWFAKTSPSASSYQLYSCEFADENTGIVFVNFATVPGGNVFKTTNGGDNWSQYAVGAASENIYSADMVDADIGYCTMNQSNRPVYKTTNGGVNWSPLTTGLTGSIRSVSAPDANTVYVCQTGGTSRVAKSTNGGANWTLITLPVAADFSSIKFKDANTGYVSGNNTTVVAKTTNGGTNWTFQNTHGVTNGKIYVSQGDTAWSLGGISAISRYTSIASPLKVNLTILMEAMYSPVSNTLARKDNVKLYLRNAFSPYGLIDSATAVIDSVSHSGLYEFYNAPSGKYYLVANHFNTITTWSKSGGELIPEDGSIFNYNFTTGQTQAFGNNMILVGSKYCIYSGDANKDNVIDGSDIALIDNDASVFASGYYATDLDANGIVDGSDILVSGNNAANFIGVINP